MAEANMIPDNSNKVSKRKQRAWTLADVSDFKPSKDDAFVEVARRRSESVNKNTFHCLQPSSPSIRRSPIFGSKKQATRDCHTVMSELMLRKLMTQSPEIGFIILKQLSNKNQIFNHNLFTYIKAGNNNQKKDESTEQISQINEQTLEMHEFNDDTLLSLGKKLSFWLASVISRTEEPFKIVETLDDLSEIGITGETFDDFENVLFQNIVKNVELSEDMKKSWTIVMDRLRILLSAPKCEQCDEIMIRKVPDELKDCRSCKRLFKGFHLNDLNRKDMIVHCEECAKQLTKDDLYFECKKCGPTGMIRFIRKGKLTQLERKRTGSSVCLNCIDLSIKQQNLEKPKK